jgi:arabinogalactan endo-1,4-beta-galactosidase
VQYDFIGSSYYPYWTQKDIPVTIPAPGVGWQVGAPNMVSNSALFDFTGKALSAFDVYAAN